MKAYDAYPHKSAGLFALAVPAALFAADKPNVDYPAGYRGFHRR